MYPDTEHLICKDTNTVLARYLTRDRLPDGRKQPSTCHRSFARCDQDCEVRAEEQAK